MVSLATEGAIRIWVRRANKDYEGFRNGGNVEDSVSHLFVMFWDKDPISSPSNIRRRARRLSRSLFFGNIPATAFRMIYIRTRDIRSTFTGITKSSQMHPHLFWTLLHQVTITLLLETTRVHGVMPIYYLLLLVTRDAYLTRVCHNDIVTTIH
jgi:hypothetical protein